jgi:hypothetical protein
MFSNNFRVINFIVEFNVFSKSGLAIEIGQLCAEIQLLSRRKTGKIATSRKNHFKFIQLARLLITSKIKENFGNTPGPRTVEKKALFLLKTLELLNRSSDVGEPF